MSAAQTRLEVAIDVFEDKRQRALIVPMLTAGELITAITKEFRSLPYLSDTPDVYSLRRARDGTVLELAKPLGQQIKTGEHLILVEAEPPLPEGTQRPSKNAYLREEGTGNVYKLHWLPAVIGRLDGALPHNERIIVNLGSHPRGLRVSRRHAQLTEHNGRFYIEGLSQNPTMIKDAQGTLVSLNGRPVPLEHGQTILLEQSQIAFKFIVRTEERSA